MKNVFKENFKIKMKKILFFLSILLLSCQKREKLHLIKGLAQGSTYSISYISDSEKVKKHQIDSILNLIDLSLSTYREDSKISKFNKGENIELDPYFNDVLTSSIQINQESGGVFDPSIGVIINAWGFGESKNKKILSQKEVDSLLAFTGMDKVFVENGLLKRKNNHFTLNFNAIAQGYSCDVLADFLKEKNIQNFIVEVGGEMYISGRQTIKNKNWTIGIDDPLSKERKTLTTLSVKDKGLATSGNYRKVWTDSLTGKKYVHTIDALTGFPKQTDILSATILAKSSMLADAYATIIMALGEKKAREFIKKTPEIQALIINSKSEIIKFNFD